MGNLPPFVRPASSATRETAFDVEGVPHKLKLLHNIFENGTDRMYDDQPGCFDEFGPFTVLANGINPEGARYVKTGYVEAYPNKNTFYYLNDDGRFFLMNPDGSKFMIKKDGSEWYLGPDTAPASPSPQANASPSTSTSTRAHGADRVATVAARSRGVYVPTPVPSQAVGGTPVKLEVTVNLKLEGARRQAEEENHEVSGCCSWASRWW